jgi:hypothetical protein
MPDKAKEPSGNGDHAEDDGLSETGNFELRSRKGSMPRKRRSQCDRRREAGLKEKSGGFLCDNDVVMGIGQA